MFFKLKQWWVKIRRQVLVEGKSKREVIKETGIHWKTLERVLGNSQPPGYQMKEPRPKPIIGRYLEKIANILEANRELPKKQRHTAKKYLRDFVTNLRILAVTLR